MGDFCVDVEGCAVAADREGEEGLSGLFCSPSAVTSEPNIKRASDAVNVLAPDHEESLMAEQDPSVLAGFCACGCGGKTTLYWGVYRRFIRGHNARGKRPAKDHAQRLAAHRARWAEAGIEYGLCLCGCGRRTTTARQTRRERGWIANEPTPYLKSHRLRLSGPDYLIEDRGYETPCWIWQRAQVPTGYAHDGTGGAHRTAYIAAKGPIPEGLELDHLCRVRACVNPDHLEAVTHVVNCQRAGKLTWDDVRAIRASTLTNTELASRYGVVRHTIRKVRLRETWRD